MAHVELRPPRGWARFEPRPQESPPRATGTGMSSCRRGPSVGQPHSEDSEPSSSLQARPTLFSSTLHSDEHSNSNLFHPVRTALKEVKSPVLPLPLPGDSSQPLTINIPPRNLKHAVWRGTYLRNSVFSNYFSLGTDLWKTSSSFQIVITTYKNDSYRYSYFIKTENHFLWEPFLFFKFCFPLTLSHTLGLTPVSFTFHLQITFCPSALTFPFRGWQLIASILQNKVGTEYI